VIERELPIEIHGRYLVEPARDPARPAPLLVGFHGYGEPAEVMLARLVAIPGSDAWIRCAVQGLHRFYRGRDELVVASWMTRQGRLLAIDDNQRYVGRVVAALRDEHAVAGPLVYAGFSQGVAMAFRAAAHSGAPAAGVIAAGGDLPPDLHDIAWPGAPRVLYGRGAGDTWFDDAKLTRDAALLRAGGLEVATRVFAGGHEWLPEFSAAAGDFLAALLERPPVPRAR
jgi:predicted esterase